MSPSVPASLSRLIQAEGSEDQERAWQAFLGEHSRLVHLAARRSARGYDDVMDRYTFVLEALRKDDFRRLRAYSEGGRSRFTTWLVVVASRLCVDYHRSKYGRLPSGLEASPQAEERKRLTDLVGEAVDWSAFPDPSTPHPDEQLHKQELRDRIASALASLDVQDRVLIRLRFEDERPMTEIARTLGLSSEFVGYRRLRAALERVREELVKRGVEAAS